MYETYRIQTLGVFENSDKSKSDRHRRFNLKLYPGPNVNGSAKTVAPFSALVAENYGAPGKRFETFPSITITVNRTSLTENVSTNRRPVYRTVRRARYIRR